MRGALASAMVSHCDLVPVNPAFGVDPDFLQANAPVYYRICPMGTRWATIDPEGVRVPLGTQGCTEGSWDCGTLGMDHVYLVVVPI